METERGHPLKVRSREKTPPRTKKSFFSLYPNYPTETVAAIPVCTRCFFLSVSGLYDPHQSPIRIKAFQVRQAQAYRTAPGPFRAPEIRRFHTVSKCCVSQILWLSTSPVTAHGMGEPSCYSIHSPLGGSGGFQSGLVVYSNPVAGSPPHPNCLLILLHSLILI